MMMGSYQLSRHRPKLMKAVLRQGAKRLLPENYDLDRHFKPKYDPWDERLCVVPDGDLFKAIRHGRRPWSPTTSSASTRPGIALKSGEHLDADIIVTATGLNALPLGGTPLTVDGERVNLPDTMGYKGTMLSGVPNMAFVVGYTNASLDAQVRPHLPVDVPAHQPHGRAAGTTTSSPTGTRPSRRSPSST